MLYQQYSELIASVHCVHMMSPWARYQVLVVLLAHDIIKCPLISSDLINVYQWLTWDRLSHRLRTSHGLTLKRPLSIRGAARELCYAVYHFPSLLSELVGKREKYCPLFLQINYHLTLPTTILRFFFNSLVSPSLKVQFSANKQVIC